MLFFFTNNAFTEDVLSLLNNLPDITATEITTLEDTTKGLQRFSILIEQPLNHFNPELGKFSQRVVLFHRGFQEPMLMQTTGYDIRVERLSIYATMFETNQIQVEYRFFGKSVPKTIDWSLLTIRQSAEDFHHIVQVFKKLYNQKWISTGTSKGGQTSIDNRRYYPRDVDGTIANVAPFSFSMSDTRYSEFLKHVGGNKYAACRDNLTKFQLLLLERRESFFPNIYGEFNLLGSKEDAFNFTVNELPAVFWQYTNPENKEHGCNAIAEAIDQPDKAFDLLKNINAVENYNDEEHSRMQPFYIQASYELGYTHEDSSKIQHFFAKKYDLSSVIPADLNLNYTNASAIDTTIWMANEAENMLLLYGEYDSWTPGAIIKLRQNADNHRYVVEGGNHTSYFLDLPEKEKNEYIAILSKWFNKSLPTKLNKSLLKNRNYSKKESMLEEVELNMR